MEKSLAIDDANSEGAHFDSTERAVAGDGDHRRWVELHDILHPRLDVTDRIAVDEI